MTDPLHAHEIEGGMAQFQIELETWHGVNHSDRRCRECGADTGHWMMSSAAWYTQRKPVNDHVSHVDHLLFSYNGCGCQSYNITLVLACHDMKAAKRLYVMVCPICMTSICL